MGIVNVREREIAPATSPSDRGGTTKDGLVRELADKVVQCKSNLNRIDLDLSRGALRPEERTELSIKRDEISKLELEAKQIARENGIIAEVNATVLDRMKERGTASAVSSPPTHISRPISSLRSWSGSGSLPSYDRSSRSESYYGRSSQSDGLRDAPRRVPNTDASPVRKYETDAEYAGGLSRESAGYSNLDMENFRDSHHGPGFKRALTKVAIFGLAVGVEAAAQAFARRVTAGDVPFDFLPGESESSDLDQFTDLDVDISDLEEEDW